MAIIQKIRNRSGLMLIVIGGCLVLFILSDALSRRGGASTGDPNSIGEVDGSKISREEYNQFVKSMEDNAKQRGQMLSDYNRQQFNEQAWNTLVDLAIREKEYEAVGVSTSDDEVATIFYSNQYYLQKFAQDLKVPAEEEKVREALMNTENKELEVEADMLQNDIRRQLNYFKYQRLIQSAFLPTNAEAKYQYAMDKITNEFRVGVLPYSMIADSTIKVSEDEMKEAYNKEKDSYQQKESRDIRFVSFPLNPSAEDEQKLRTAMEGVKARFAELKNNDGNFVNTETEGASYENAYYTKGTGLPLFMDSSFASLHEGQMFGPFIEFNGSQRVMKVAKVVKVKMLADSVKVKHILISVRGEKSIPGSEAFHLPSGERMVAVADSLAKILKTKPELFDAMVQKHSDDFESVPKGGDIGWISKNSAHADLFDSAMVTSAGSVIKVFSNKDGYHLVKVVQHGQLTKKVNPGIISRSLNPSKKTLDDIYLQAKELMEAVKSGKNIDSAANDRQLVVMAHPGLGKNDLYISNLEGARDVVKWAYNANVGDVSDIFTTLPEKYVVAVVEKESKEGAKPFEDVKKEIEIKLIIAKKGEILSKKLNDAMAGGANLNALKAKFPELFVDSIPATPVGGNASFGNEPDVMGMVAAMPLNKLSKPVVGKQGVFLVLVFKREGAGIEMNAIKDFSLEKGQVAQKSKSLVDQFITEALKTGVDIEDNRYEKLD
ncbi:MAG: peptidylprolyl isomerase [Flavobacteriales bacterium]